MIEITKDYNVVASGKNLSVLRRYASKIVVDTVYIDEGKNGTGTLAVKFLDDAYCVVEFASFEVLKKTVSNWRNLWGAVLIVNTENKGELTNKSFERE